MELGVHLPLLPFGDEPPSLRRLEATVDTARDCGFAAISANDHLVFQTPWLDGLTALASIVARSGDMALLNSRDLEPLAVASYVALIGTSDAIEPLRSMDDLASRLDLSHVSTSAARFDLAELRALNARFLHATPYLEIAERLSARGISGGEAFWDAVRGNISVFDDVDEWWTVVSGPVQPIVEDADFLAKAATVLPAEPWGEATWGEWTNAVKAATGAKGRALFHPLRLALTARESGPELKALLPIIGREKALARISGRTA